MALDTAFLDVQADQILPVRMACECSRTACRSEVQIAPLELRLTRLLGRFVVAPGHEVDGLERVVDWCARYRIVERRDLAGAGR